MKNGEAGKIALRSLWNRQRGWPICVSFEVTHSCVADCLHCDKGGPREEKAVMRPADYRRYSEELKPVVCQLSGGEPLMREDLEGIVTAVKRPSGLPLVVCVSNFWLMTEERYLALQDAGVSIFSFSLDFPDERHDDFRCIPGLFAKMNELIPILVSKYGRGNIVLNSALTHANYTEIPGLVAKAEEWGVQISFSAYSCLRTGDKSLCINAPKDIAVLRQHMDYLEEHKRETGSIINSDYILEQTYGFFANGGTDGCKAGRRFLVVRPDGLINACSMYPEVQYKSRTEAQKGFRPTRKECGQCYVSIRASTERSLWRLLTENLAARSSIPSVTTTGD